MKKIFLFVFFSFLSNAQIAINNTSYTPSQLVNGVLVPSTSGITISNVTFNGVYNVSSRYQIGYFSTSNSTLAAMGFSSGIVLTSGNTSEIPLTLGTNPGSAAQMSRNFGSCTVGEIRKGGSCPTVVNDFVQLAGASNSYFNTAVLEFDFIPFGDNISFRYIFGSEEYSDSSGMINYQCSSYNDKFGFLLSGPGISGGQGFTNDAKNIARLANGSQVSINSVNNGVVGSGGGAPNASNCIASNASWTLNTPTPEFLGTIDGTQFNGNTRILTATQSGLQIGSTYHIKMIVMDIGDGGYDSAVYLEALSFKSECKKPGITGAVNNPTKVGIGTFETINNQWPDSIPNGFLALDSSNKGMVVSRITTSERNLLNAVEGMLIYNTTENCFQIYNGTIWNCLAPTCVE